MDTLAIVVALLLIVCVTIYQIRVDFYNRKRMFDIQIEMAKAQQSMTKDMTWTEIKTIINDIISFSVSKYIMNNGLHNMNNEELSLSWTMILGELCPMVETSLSDEIKRQAMKHISLDYFTRFIKNSVEIVIVYQLETNKENKVNDRLTKIQGKAHYQLNEFNKK